MNCCGKLHAWDIYDVPNRWKPQRVRCLIVGENPGEQGSMYFYDVPANHDPVRVRTNPDCYRMRPAQNRRSQFPQRYCLIDANLNNLSSKSRRRARLIRSLLQSGHVITRKCLYSLIGRSKYPISVNVRIRRIIESLALIRKLVLIKTDRSLEERERLATDQNRASSKYREQ